MNKKPVAIIGSGFLATNLILELERKGYPIHVFSRSHPKAEIQTTTIFHAIDLTKESIPNENLVSCTKIFFMVSIGIPGHQNSSDNFRLEFEILKSIVSKAKSLLIQDFYFISSSAVYGDQSNSPMSEEDNLNPLSEYAKNKVMMEEYLIDQKLDIFNPIIFRLSNPYGPYQYSQGIIQKLLDASIKERVIVIDNLGESIRDYIYIEDCIYLIVKLMETENQYPVYNISTGIGTSTNELINIFNMSGLTVLFQYEGNKSSPKFSISILDNSRIIHELNESEMIGVQAGIRKTIHHKLN